MRFETAGFESGFTDRETGRLFVAGSAQFINFPCCRETACPVGQELTTRLNNRPVGFKLIGELINEDQIILNGEESKGLSIKGPYPKKDGFVASRLQAQTVASRKSIDAPIGRRIEDSR